MSGSYVFVWFYFGKMWIFFKNSRFFRADMTGLGKYHMGGYGRIGVYRVKQRAGLSSIGQYKHRCEMIYFSENIC